MGGGGVQKAYEKHIINSYCIYLTLNSCKKCGAAGDDNASQGGNNKTMHGSIKPPPLEKELPVGVKESLDDVKAAKARVEILVEDVETWGEDAGRWEQNLEKAQKEVREISFLVVRVAMNAEAMTDVPKDVAADVAQVYREEAAALEAMRKIFAAKKNNRSHDEAEKAYLAA
jgi:hypothetical protein